MAAERRSKRSRERQDEIVILGTGCLILEASSPNQFWQNVLSGRDATREATAREMGIDPATYDHLDKGHPDTYYSTRGSFVRKTELETAR